MGFRFVVWLSLAIGCWGQERHSDWYVESLRGVMQWEPSDAARMEAALRKEPGDLRARLQLMAYAMRADQAQEGASAQRRFRHVVWLLENEPASEVLRSGYARFGRDQLGAQDWVRSKQLWRAAKGDAAAIAWNAAKFFEGVDAREQWGYLERAVELNPDNATAIRLFALKCAEAIVAGGERRVVAEAALQRSSNPWLQGNAEHMLAQLRSTHATVIPKVTMRMGEVKRLGPAKFAELPMGLVEFLTRRGCQIPQPSGEKAKRSVIRGEFFAKGEVGWAVLCSVGGKSSILAFRNDEDRAPAVLAAAEDQGYMQGMGGDTYEYSRMINVVAKDFIVGHYRAFGGPKPPAIDHAGIDDAFLGKASRVWYFHAGKWLSLQGSD